uniref:Uncharacterized protein n=1 Tax=Anguilla anguilla TaxID=7936 RepID=A0A0E9PXH6_ANGAN
MIEIYDLSVRGRSLSPLPRLEGEIRMGGRTDGVVSQSPTRS